MSDRYTTRTHGPYALVIAAAFCVCFGVNLCSAADSPWLYGIHWYDNPANDDVEVMTGGKGIWDIEIVLTEDSGTWGLDAQLPSSRRSSIAGTR